MDNLAGTGDFIRWKARYRKEAMVLPDCYGIRILVGSVGCVYK
jgi:hypothetical protein